MTLSGVCFALLLLVMAGVILVAWPAMALVMVLDPTDGFERAVGFIMALLWVLCVAGTIARLNGW